MEAPVKPKAAGPREIASGPVQARRTNYRQLRNPFPVMSVFSDDEAANMHETALRMLEELGMKRAAARGTRHLRRRWGAGDRR
jgi:trimethylamine--corrinoid protein Co-methyltransferase